jgi:4-amino-4-deoxy-L-arabinose transferase-like glycosyltransferase
MPASSIIERFRRHDAHIVLLLFLIALCFRIPYLFTAPEFKPNELEVTLQLLKGERFPLHNQAAHLGALANYIVAIAFLICGRHFWVPRIVILLMGSFTVALLYPLGKKLIGKSAAILGSLLLAGSMYHIFTLSHLSWSNCMTPFFTVCFLLSFITGLQSQKSSWLVLSGFLLGLALQTHPSVITLVPFVICAFLIQGKEKLRSWLKKPAPYLMILAVLLGYANMIYFNILRTLETFQHAFTYPGYSLEENPGLQTYFHNMNGEWMLLLRLLSGAAEEQKAFLYYWKNPVFLLCTVAFLAGILLCIRRRKWELPLHLAFPISIIPIINKGYEFCKFGRYLGFLMPIACLVSAYAAIELLTFLRSRKLLPAAVTFIIWLILPAMYFAYHYDQLRKTYVALQSQDQSLFTFRQVRSFLQKYDKEHTGLLIDEASWKATSLMVFLETDGWSVSKLGVKGNRRSNFAHNTELYLDTNFQPSVLDKIHNAPDFRIIALVSPLSLKSLFLYAPIAACKGCVSAQPTTGTIYHQVIDNIYYLFELGPVRIRDNPAEDSLLTLLSEASPSLPDQFSDAKKLARQKIVLTTSVKRAEVKSDMEAVCKPAFIDVPEQKCRICPENLSAAYSWDHLHRYSADEKHKKHEMVSKKKPLSGNSSR